MANKIFKGLAVAAGTGLAIGFGSRRSTQATSMDDSSDTILALEPLLDRLDSVEARVSAVEAHVAEIPREVPAILESLLARHVEEVRARLHEEMRESVQATLTSFERTLDDQVSLRIAPLEKALMEQSAVVASLGRRALEAEENFQRLISAVERLCEPKEQPVLDLPFERHLSEAFQRQPPPSGFRPRILKDDEIKPRHRHPLATL
jgi:hypothetical protein